MELRGRSRYAAENDVLMLNPEMEAAEALAGLACCSAVRGGACPGSDDLEIPTQNLVKESMLASSLRPSQEAAMARSGSETEETVRILPSQLCSTSHEPNSATKLKQSLTESEKEEQRLRRVLANRESARKTIRRRQAMHQELIRKSADLTEENKNLKKERERVMEEYNSLKSRNDLLKLQMANVRKAESGETETEPVKSSQSETSTSTTITTPIVLCNHPSLVPFFLPSVVPSSNVVPMQFPMQDKDIAPSLRQGNQLFILPVPCLLPIGVMPLSCPETSSKHECSMSTSSETFLMSTKCSLKGNINDCDVNSAPNHVMQSSGKKIRKPIICGHGRRDDAFAATTARRRRKELMRLKEKKERVDETKGYTRNRSSNY